jgi:hypothetical protein
MVGLYIVFLHKVQLHVLELENGHLQVVHEILIKQSVKREKTNKMQQSYVYYQLLSQLVSGIIMLVFRRSKTVLLHVVYCSGSAGCDW